MIAHGCNIAVPGRCATLLLNLAAARCHWQSLPRPIASTEGEPLLRANGIEGNMYRTSHATCNVQHTGAHCIAAIQAPNFAVRYSLCQRQARCFLVILPDCWWSYSQDHTRQTTRAQVEVLGSMKRTSCLAQPQLSVVILCDLPARAALQFTAGIGCATLSKRRSRDGLRLRRVHAVTARRRHDVWLCANCCCLGLAEKLFESATHNRLPESARLVFCDEAMPARWQTAN